MTTKKYVSLEMKLTDEVEDVILTSGFDTPDDNFGDDEDETVETPIIPGNRSVQAAYEL